eukprot:94253-Pyramimonas_sp.AAC.1
MGKSLRSVSKFNSHRFCADVICPCRLSSPTVWTLRAILWMLRATWWTLRAIMWMLRAIADKTRLDVCGAAVVEHDSGGAGRLLRALLRAPVRAGVWPPATDSYYHNMLKRGLKLS